MENNSKQNDNKTLKIHDIKIVTQKNNDAGDNNQIKFKYTCIKCFQ